jgi:hypothetical protein
VEWLAVEVVFQVVLAMLIEKLKTQKRLSLEG